MNWILRNIGVHLWLATLFTVPTVFFILPVLKPVFPGIDPATAAGVIFVCCFTGLGSLMDIAARKAVALLIREGQAWERSGVVQKAKKAYNRAIRIYDTFLFWPFFSKRTAVIICGAIAKFNVNENKGNLSFDLASTIYLKQHPEDEDVALAWLSQLGHKHFVTSLDQDVLTLVAHRHFSNPDFSQIIAELFIGLERKDFAARKLYKYLMSSAQFKDSYEKKIQDLIGDVGSLGKSLGEKKDEKTLEEDKSFVLPKIKIRKKVNIGELFKKTINNLFVFFKKGVVWLGSALSFIVLSLGRIYVWIKDHPKAKSVMKIALLSIVFLWLAFFMINTLSHMFKSKTVEKTSENQIEVQVEKPFTIQVAAYLKLEHADRYINLLKKKGIKAHVKKMDGGGKTWFLVRVSQFADKKSAAEYGSQLKQQKIIDDFFVNNK